MIWAGIVFRIGHVIFYRSMKPINVAQYQARDVESNFKSHIGHLYHMSKKYVTQTFLNANIPITKKICRQFGGHILVAR